DCPTDARFRGPRRRGRAAGASSGLAPRTTVRHGGPSSRRSTQIPVRGRNRPLRTEAVAADQIERSYTRHRQRIRSKSYPIVRCLTEVLFSSFATSYGVKRMFRAIRCESKVLLTLCGINASRRGKWETDGRRSVDDEVSLGSDFDGGVFNDSLGGRRSGDVESDDRDAERHDGKHLHV